MFKKRVISKTNHRNKAKEISKDFEDIDEAANDNEIDEAGTKTNQDVISPSRLLTQSKISKQTPKLQDKIEKNLLSKLKVSSDNINNSKATPKSVIKSTTSFDFQRDICKDFKQNGYCGYGDTCKFLHIREFKPISIEKSKDQKESPIIDDKKCAVCGCESDLVKASCGHVFCNDCVLKKYKVGKCGICGKIMNGIFNKVR